MQWNIKGLKCLQNGEDYIIRRVLWDCEGKSGESETPYIIYNNPTEEEIISWIEAYIGEVALADFTHYTSPPLDPNCEGVLVMLHQQQGQ